VLKYPGVVSCLYVEFPNLIVAPYQPQLNYRTLLKVTQPARRLCATDLTLSEPTPFTLAPDQMSASVEQHSLLLQDPDGKYHY